MPDLIIETRNLNFYFGKQQILNDVSLNVAKESIYGFLGPNGAGKTTTIKLLLNLLGHTEGQIFLFGKDLATNRREILSKIGSLIEQPSIYGHLTGRENLYNRAMLLQVDHKRIDQILELVDLKKSASKKASAYSLGMKQRLGIGLALLGDPELLILDEPTNGLDPNGIIEVRELLKNLVHQHGKTVFVSSHLLAEIERMATKVGIIHKGTLLFQGSISDLKALNKPVLTIETNNNERAAEILIKKGFENPEITEKGIEIPFLSQANSAEVNKLLVQNEINVYSFYQTQKDLENLFLSITQNS